MTLVCLHVREHEHELEAELPPTRFLKATGMEVPWKDWLQQFAGPSAFIETTDGQLVQVRHVICAFEPP